MSSDDLILLADCPDLVPVSKAPTFAELETRAELMNKEIREIMFLESRISYGAVKEGRAYSVQNPALMSYQQHMRCTVIKRRQPELISAARQNHRRSPSKRFSEY